MHAIRQKSITKAQKIKKRQRKKKTKIWQGRLVSDTFDLWSGFIISADSPRWRWLRPRRCGPGDAAPAMRPRRCGSGDAAPAMRLGRCGSGDGGRIDASVAASPPASISPDFFTASLLLLLLLLLYSCWRCRLLVLFQILRGSGKRTFPTLVIKQTRHNQR